MTGFAEQIANQIQDSAFDFTTVKEFLRLIETQQKQYTEFSFIGNGAFTLVLKAKKNGKTDVALKAILWDADSSSDIQR